MEEEQPPVAHAHPLAQLQPDAIGVVQIELDLFQEGRARAFDLFLRRRVLHDVVDRLQHAVARGVERRLLPDFGGEQRNPGSCSWKSKALVLVAFFVSTSALYSRPDGSSPRICTSRLTPA